MSELRKRQASESRKGVGGDRRNDVPSTGAYVLPSWFSFARLGIFVISLAASVACFLYSRKHLPLPNSYAICSRSGAHIYTVDEVVPKVQCLVIDESFIVDSGYLGMSKWTTQKQLSNTHQ